MANPDPPSGDNEPIDCTVCGAVLQGPSGPCPECGFPVALTRSVLEHGPVGVMEAWAVLEQDALSDEKIAGHEAGHATIAHGLDIEVLVVNAYTGEHSASVDVDWPQDVEQKVTSLVASAGIAAEQILGGASYPCASCGDLRKNRDPAHIGVTRRLIERHPTAFLALQAHILAARKQQSSLDGRTVHDLLERHGAERGYAKDLV